MEGCASLHANNGLEHPQGLLSERGPGIKPLCILPDMIVLCDVMLVVINIMVVIGFAVYKCTEST